MILKNFFRLHARRAIIVDSIPESSPRSLRPKLSSLRSCRFSRAFPRELRAGVRNCERTGDDGARAFAMIERKIPN